MPHESAKILHFTLKPSKKEARMQCVCEGHGWVHNPEKIETLGGTPFITYRKAPCFNTLCQYREPKLNPDLLNK